MNAKELVKLSKTAHSKRMASCKQLAKDRLPEIYAEMKNAASCGFFSMEYWAGRVPDREISVVAAFLKELLKNDGFVVSEKCEDEWYGDYPRSNKRHSVFCAPKSRNLILVISWEYI